MISNSNTFPDKDINDKTNNNIEFGLSQSLHQGKQFKQYHSKIENSLEKQSEILSGKREGFSEMNSNNLNIQTTQTTEIINTNNYSNEMETIDNLRKEYNNTLQEYEKLTNEITSNATSYINRVSSNNPYLNKTIVFSDGKYAYVTNQGVVKYIPSTEIWDSVKAPKNVIEINIPWNNSYFTPGTIIPTDPPLISGTPVKKDQSLGNEGSNVFVDQLLPPISESTYMGCFATNKNNDNMTFIGDTPPAFSDVSIQNGNFSKPVISADSVLRIKGSTVPGWNFDATLLNNSSKWGIPMPYPGGNQCVIIQNNMSINTVLSLQSGSTYILKFQACGRNCCKTSTSNPINIELYTNLNAFISQIANFTAPINSWTSYTYTFTVPISQTYKLLFKGINRTGDRSTALADISLNSSAVKEGSYSYQDCRESAIANGYRYFGLQNVNTSSKLGYCAVSDSEPAITQYGRSQVVSELVPLWSSNTAGNPDNTAILTDRGSLQVLNSSGKALYSSPESLEGKINCILIIQENGDMAIYKGTNPNNIQGEIWSAMTIAKQEQANPDVVASKGKYGQNWMTNGSTLAPGDFIGSNDGKLALVMQTDGNLVLYTYKMDTNCEKIDDKFGGGKGAIAVYDIGMSAIPKNMGDLAFVDGDSNLYTYPVSNEKYSDKYSIIKNIDAVGNDISGAALTGSSIETCKKTCNSNPECAGFVTNANGTLCWPKNSQMYPFGGEARANSDRNVYVRSKRPSSLPIGVSSNTNSVNTIDYQNYINKGEVGNEYGLANATSIQKQRLEQLRSKMNMLSKQIADLTNKFQRGSVNTQQQSNQNQSSINKYFEDLNNTNNKISGITEYTSEGIKNILKDSDIVVLQKNYEYLFWSILAVGTVLVAMNVVKKE
jgi:hypothetical protein